MSLIAHYKLDGDASDSSGYGNHGTILGNPQTVGGILGQALSFDGAGDYITAGNIPAGLTEYSISFWLKWGGGSSWSPFIAARVSGSNIDFQFWVGIDGGLDFAFSSSGSYTAVTKVLPSNLSDESWHFLTATVNNGVITLYVDSTSVYSAVRDVDVTTGQPIVIGRDGSSGANYGTGTVDDLKIYDHALSQKEIKELNKAKVLHYKFDDFQEPTENVVTNTDLDTGWSKSYAANILWNDISPPPGVNSPVVSFENDDTTGGGYWYSYGDYAPQTDGTTYTPSLWVKTNQVSNISIRAYTGDNSETGRYNSEYRTVNAAEGWKRIVWNSFTTPSPNDSDSLSFKIEGHYENGYTRLWLCAPQMEAKPYATPFTTGIRSSTVMDCSSQDNHTDLELSYTPEWVNDSKLGSGCYHLDGSGEADSTVQGSNIKVNESLTNTNNYPEGCTYSFWINVDTDAVNRMSLLWGSSTIRHIEIYSSSKYFRTEAATQNGYSFGSSTFPDDVRGQWAHFAIVFANGETNRPVRWYQNGTLFHTDSMDGGTNPGGEYFSFSSIGRATGTSTYPYAPSFDGRVDDFRIYAEALSVDDIEELAKTRASLDDEGNFHAVGINETKHSPLILDYTLWQEGTTGSVGSFSRNGSDSENHRILGIDPWGKETVIWEARPDSTSGPDGGWNFYQDVDQSKMYRYSVWVWRNMVGQGNFYLGTSGYNGGTNIGVKVRGSTSTTTNPYFYTTDTGIQTGRWELIVGHMWPFGSGEGSNHSDSGRYTVNGRYAGISNDFTWLDNTTRTRWRTYLYYSTDTSQRQRWVYPRMDIIDGTEPSIADLLAGHDSRKIERVREKGGTSNISLDVGDKITDLGTMSEIGPTNGMVSYYPLNGNSDDYSGDNNATTSNITYGAGIRKGARISGSATAPTDPVFNVKGDMTLSFWFRPDASGARRVVMQTAYAGSFCINHETAGDLRFYNGDNSAYDSLDSSVLTNGQWYHCVAVRQGSTKYWYLDGTLDVSGATSHDGGTRTDPLDIATGYTGNDIVGALCEVRIYNRALQPEEISILYSMTGPSETKMKQTRDTLYVKGEFKETY